PYGETVFGGLIDRVARADVADIVTDLFRLVLEIGRSLPDELCDMQHLRLAEAARGDSRGADALAGGHERAFRVVRDGVLVCGDIHLVQTALELLAGDAGLAQVDQHEVVVRAAG